MNNNSTKTCEYCKMLPSKVRRNSCFSSSVVDSMPCGRRMGTRGFFGSNEYEANYSFATILKLGNEYFLGDEDEGDGVSKLLKINFCPFCGRKLK